MSSGDIQAGTRSRQSTTLWLEIKSTREWQNLSIISCSGRETETLSGLEQLTNSTRITNKVLEPRIKNPLCEFSVSLKPSNSEDVNQSRLANRDRITN